MQRISNREAKPLLHIRIAEHKDREAWNAFVDRHPQGLAYHSYAWKQAVEEAYGFKGLYLLAEKAGVVQGLLPLVQMKSPFAGGRLVSLPYCDVGGCLSVDESTRKALLRKALSLAEESTGGQMEIRWAYPLDDACQFFNGMAKKVRMVLDLPAGSTELLASLKSKLRSQIKKPQRDGLRCSLGGKELIDEFYPIFAENMRDLGSPVHSRKWIKAVVKHYDDKALVGVAYSPDGRAAAAGILLLHPRTASVPWASSLRRYNHLNANMLLYWRLLSYAADNGYPAFDFGRSTPGCGTYRFKEQWGARPQPLFWQDQGKSDAENHVEAVVSPRRRLAQAVWSHLPLRMTTLLGPPLRRNISL